MNWQEVWADPVLQDPPAQIERKAWGRILMSPAGNRQGVLLAWWVEARRDGMVSGERPVPTAEGVKVSDVARASAEFLTSTEESTPHPRVAELGAEVAFTSTSSLERAEKRELCFARGTLAMGLGDEQG